MAMGERTGRDVWFPHHVEKTWSQSLFVMFYAPNDPIRGSDEHLSIALSVPTPENTARRRRHKMLGKLAAKFRCEQVASMRTLKSSF